MKSASAKVRKFFTLGELIVHNLDGTWAVFARWHFDSEDDAKNFGELKMHMEAKGFWPRRLIWRVSPTEVAIP